MQIEILKKTNKEFIGEDGEKRPYFWYIGKKTDGNAIRFGSTEGTHKIGGKEEILLEEKTYRNGGTGFAEIVLGE